MTAEGHVQVYNFTHALLDEFHILVGQRFIASFLEVAVVAQRQRMLDEQFAAGEHVATCLVEHETERPYIHAVTGAAAGVDKLHIAVLVEPELESL